METYRKAMELVDNPHFYGQRQNALRELDLEAIDEPIMDLITGFGKLSYCFTLQCCYGHFLYGNQTDDKNVGPLSDRHIDIDVVYRIAYLALCVQNNELGRALRKDLCGLTLIDPDYIQYGSADWFWERQKNSYVVQVEPERHKLRDQCVVNYCEARHIERVRNEFFDELGNILGKRM